MNNQSYSSMFQDISAAPPVEVFKLSADYQADTFPSKVSLGVGAYRDDAGKPWILPVVKKAEMQLAKDIEEEKINHEYLPVLGHGGYAEAAVKLILGKLKFETIMRFFKLFTNLKKCHI